MARTFLISPAFAKAALVEDAMEYLYSSNDLSFIDAHIVIDGWYPIDRKNNRVKIAQSALSRGAYYLDAKYDRGLHRNLNYAVEQFGITEKDLVLGLDFDDRPSPGALRALHNVMHCSGEFGVLGLSFSVIKQREKEGVFHERKIIAGEEVLIHPSIEMFNVVAFNMAMVKQNGGFNQLFNYYGGLECALLPTMHKMGLRLGYLKNHVSDALEMDRSNLNFFDPEYREWKTAHVGGYQHGFEQWLQENGKAHLCE